MMVVSDLDDIFIPLPDDLLVNLSESRTVVDAFLDSLPSMFHDNGNVESAFGPALKSAFMVMVSLFSFTPFKILISDIILLSQTFLYDAMFLMMFEIVNSLYIL